MDFELKRTDVFLVDACVGADGLYLGFASNPASPRLRILRFDKDLREHIWSAGNRVIFNLSNHNDAYEVAKQIFPYDPRRIKLEAKTETQNPVSEPDRGQYLEIANWIQQLTERECIIKRHLTEQRLDPYVRHIPRTPDIAAYDRVSDRQGDEVKDMLIRRHGIGIKDAMREVNERLRGIPTTRKPPTV